MEWILITNDDGVDSPALVPLVHAIGGLGRVEVVVPDQERSWIGKAVTRHRPVTTDRRERDGVAIMTTSGYPADCVQLAVHTLYPSPPRLVVSGINVGYNNGAGYIQSSGTVGAAMEALLADTPAVAFSAGSHSRPWDVWKRWVHTDEAAGMWNRLAGIAADIVGRLLAADPPPAVVNVNLPDDATTETVRTITTVAPVGYERLFRADGEGRFVHDFGGGLTSFGSLTGSDVEAAQRGEISITALRPLGTGAFTPDLAAALTRT
ncbi:MAG: 5'/3'-nucleotidase SurE [Acidimicrobiia bacterium]|nr:5'/3'-nucleotidase SurE [Acidimicrobiia bacterium]NNF10406.1 5'/3'-nucleotidase SurE [Acidimicrobiia bacterium]NNL68599.1 5'/3'-nucleotidase SurE [Acidimicrobiia bacterium]